MQDAISIHAPPRGATFFFTPPFTRISFQFTPLREGRLFHLAIYKSPSYFNSRPSARGDIAIIWRWMCRSYFNSRPSARGDARRY